LKKLEGRVDKHGEKFKDFIKQIAEILEMLGKDDDKKSSSSSDDEGVDKDDFKKLEKKFEHHVEDFEKLEKLFKEMKPGSDIDVKDLEKKWKKEIDHECDKLEKKIKHLKKDEKEHEKDHKGEFADKHVTKETFEMIYKKLRAL